MSDSSVHPDTLFACHDVMECVHSGRSENEILRGILAHACFQTGATHGSIAALARAECRLRHVMVYGPAWTAEGQAKGPVWGEGLLGRVAASGQASVCGDTAAEDASAPQLAGMSSALAVPIMVRDQVWGVINVESAAPRAFDEGSMTRLTTIARLAALAISAGRDREEQVRWHKRLAQSERLATLGESLAGVVHEINNPLTAIMGFASLLQEDQRDVGPQGREAIEAILTEAQRAAELVRGVLGFARSDGDRRERFDVNSLVGRVAMLRRFQRGASCVRLHVTISSTPAWVEANPVRLLQVLLNLVVNGEQAIGRGRGDGLVRLIVEVRDATVQIAVIDNGGGIHPEVQSRIFEPFFTTKPIGEGSGLGLSIAGSLIREHGGSLRLGASSPAGTVFFVELPRARETAVPAASSVSPAGTRKNDGGSPYAGRVLVVDDEATIRKVLSGYLRRNGVDVLTAEGGLPALETLRTEPCDIVITDLRMRDMDGGHLFEAARRLDVQYGRKFMFMSGGELTDEVAALIERHRLPFLRKPFTFDELHSKLTPFLAAVAAQRC